MRLPALTSAALAAALIATVAGPASAADPQKGAGSASSAGSLVQLTVAGQALEALRLQMPTSTGADGSKALVSVTPLLRGGAPVVPAVEVTAGSSRELPSQRAGIAGLVELSSPSGTLSAATDPASALAQVATAVGDLELLGTDLLGEGTFSATSKVTGTSSTGTKHLVVDGLTLPTLADLLAALGLDLTKLPVGTLLDLLDELDLLTQQLLDTLTTLIDGLGLTTVDQLLGVLDGELSPTQVTSLLQTVPAPAELESAVSSVSATLAGLTAQLPVTTSGYTKSVIGGVPDLLAPVTGGGSTGGSTGGTTGGTGGGLLTPIVGTVTQPVTGAVPVVDSLTGGALAPVLAQLPTSVVDELLADINALLADPTSLQKLQDLITTLTTTLVDLVEKVLNTLLGGQLPAVADLPALLDVPLLSVGKLDVTTVARTGADELADVTGTVSGLEVLGTDVLDSVLGSSTVDLTTLLGGGGGALTQVQQLVDGTLGSVTDVLAGVTGLVLPLPQVEVLGLVEETLTDVHGVRTARAGVEALRLDWALDDIRIPAPVSSIVGGVTGGLPVDLPLGGFQASALPTGQLTALLSQPMSLVIGNLTDTSGFVPGTPVAAPGTPGTGTPGSPTTVLDPAPVRQLPRTGASALLAGVALALLGGAYALRRRNEGLAAE